MDNYIPARKRMVEEQVAARGVRDPRVLRAMVAIPRHLFVPEGQWHHAHEDHPLPLDAGQTVSQPYIVAAMTEALELTPESRVLEVGTGSGYQTAILASIAKMVYTVEIIKDLSVQARLKLLRLDVRNVRFRIGDGHDGWPEFAPYDRVIVTAAADTMPYPLAEQLVDGGKMVVPVGPPGSQVLTLLVKHGKKTVQRHLMSVAFVPFVRGEQGLGMGDKRRGTGG
jgi:protein-L-isoaspartate(D-aspartate) O-methyltransferase